MFYCFKLFGNFFSDKYNTIHFCIFFKNKYYIHDERHTHLPLFPFKEANSVFNSLTVILYAAKTPSNSINLSNEKKTELRKVIKKMRIYYNHTVGKKDSTRVFLFATDTISVLIGWRHAGRN